MKTVYFDLVCGASGDMILSSLISLGFPVELLEEQLNRLGIGEISIGVEKVKRSGISCTYINPQWSQATHYRHLGEILEIIKRGAFTERVFERCELVLDRLATAESTVHGIEKEHVHFHEIGAVDTIIDVLGVSLALEFFNVEQILFSTITEGYGSIKGEHGVMPVPVPATAQMIQNFRIKTLDIPTELCTPTGAALLTALGNQVPGGMEGRVIKCGYGCGTKVFENHPNILRVFILESDFDGGYSIDTIRLMETDMDHVSGEIMGHVAGLLTDQGALDVSFSPIFMKKGRPGYRLSVMADESNCQKLVELIMIHTRTLGVRIGQVQRVVAKRSNAEIEFMGQKLSEKRCSFKGYSFSKLEYDALEKISVSTGSSIIDLMEKYVLAKSGIQDEVA